jgi:hypothetical protein
MRLNSGVLSAKLRSSPTIMSNIKYDKVGIFLIIAVLGYLLVVWNFSVVIRFFLVIWFGAATMHFFKEKPAEVELDPTKMKMYTFDGESTTEMIIEAMKEGGYRPATLAEALIWLGAESKKITDLKLVALGSPRVVDKIRSEPVIDTRKGNAPYFTFDLGTNEWEVSYCFLGVQE